MATTATSSSSQTYFSLLQQQLEQLDHDAIDAYADLIFETWKARRRVITFGNGGSAYTASHHVTDYVKTAAVEGQPRLAAISLVDNVGLTTALGNDISYEDTFVYPLGSYAQPGDVAVAISCSGNSPNVVKAGQWARDHGLTLVAITGFTGGAIGPMADIHIHVPSDNYGVVEDIQMAVGHVVAQCLRRRVADHADGR